MTNQEALEKSYQALRPFSDRHRWEFFNNLFHLNFITSKAQKGESLADIGCGLGLLALSLKFLGYNIKGYDKYVFVGDEFYRGLNTQALIELWQKNGLEVVPADILEDSFGEDFFDGVISIATIEHQAHPQLFLKKINSLIKENGWVYIATPNIATLPNRLRFLIGRSPLSNIEEFYQQAKNFSGHWREYVLAELVFMVSQAGFDIEINKNVGVIKKKLGLNKRFFHKLLFVLGNKLPGFKDTILVFGRKSL